MIVPKKVLKKEKIHEIREKAKFNDKIKQIHDDELKTERYKMAYDYLYGVYYTRKNKRLEENLLKVVGSYDIDYNLFNKSRDVKKALINEKYKKLKGFMSSLSEKQINSNIFLKSAYDFMNMSEEVCGEIMLLLQDTVNNGEPKDISMSIPDKMEELIPNYINESIGIENDDKSKCKTAYINLLDEEHMHIYKGYNMIAQTIGKIAEDICFFKLNEMTLNKPNLECYHFQVYLPGCNNKLIARFFTNPEVKKDYFYNDDYIEETVNNFKELLDAGIIDISVLDNELGNQKIK